MREVGDVVPVIIPHPTVWVAGVKWDWTSGTAWPSPDRPDRPLEGFGRQGGMYVHLHDGYPILTAESGSGNFFPKKTLKCHSYWLKSNFTEYQAPLYTLQT